MTRLSFTCSRIGRSVGRSVGRPVGQSASRLMQPQNKEEGRKVKRVSRRIVSYHNGRVGSWAHRKIKME